MQEPDRLVDHRLHQVQLGLVVLQTVNLRFGDFRSNAGKTGEAKHQAGLQFDHPLPGKNDRGNVEGVVLQELDAVEYAEGGRDLVLGTHIFTDDVLLDVNGAAGQLFFGDVFAIQRVQGVHQADRERRAGPKTRPGRQVPVVVDFEPL